MKKSLILMAAAAGFSSYADETRPNIILCMADDLGWGDVGYNGNKIIKTPNLDKMAADGVNFTRFYSASAVCAPTRASCLIGRNPNRSGVFSANIGILRPEEVTIAELVKKEGYNTGHFGKWHLGTLTHKEVDANRGRPGNTAEFNPPTEHGFDVFFSTESKVPTWDPMKVPVNFKKLKHGSRRFGWDAIKEGEKFKHYGTHYWNNNGKVTDNLEGDDSRIIMDRALPFIENSVKEKKPFFTVIWFHTPHLPCVAGPEYAAMYKEHNFEMQQYAGCITAMDDQMGRLRKKLEELGVADNTMLCFTSDNGAEVRTPGSTGSYKSRKRSLHDGGVRVPGLMVWPEKIKKGLKLATPVVTSDYLPTVVEALAIDSPKYQLDGVSLMPLFAGKELKRPAAIGFQFASQLAWNGEKYKYYTDGKTDSLFDMETDPYETKNLAAEYPELLANLKKKCTDWSKSCQNSFEGAEYGTTSYDRVGHIWRYSNEKLEYKKNTKGNK